MSKEELSVKEELFASHYLKHFNAREAYRFTHPNAQVNTASVKGPQFLDRIQSKLAPKLDQAGYSLDSIRDYWKDIMTNQEWGKQHRLLASKFLHDSLKPLLEKEDNTGPAPQFIKLSIDTPRGEVSNTDGITTPENIHNPTSYNGDKATKVFEPDKSTVTSHNDATDELAPDQYKPPPSP